MTVSFFDVFFVNLCDLVSFHIVSRMVWQLGKLATKAQSRKLSEQRNNKD